MRPRSDGYAESAAAAGRSELLRLGAALPLGWSLLDLARFVVTGEPLQVLAVLVPGALVAAAIGAALGALAARYRTVLPFLIGGSALLALAPKLVDLPLSRAQIWLPRAVFLLSLSLALSALIQRRWPFGALRLGIAAGMLACLAKTLFRAGFALPPAPQLALAVAGVAAVLLGRVRAPLPRRLVTLVVALVPTLWIAGLAAERTRPTRADLPPQTASAPAGAPNLVLIVLDTVRADRLAPYGHERVTTPGLDAFVRDHATRYVAARSTSPFTLASHASLFTGLFPGEHGAAYAGRSSRPMRDDVPTLAEILRDRGWQTAAILANTVYLHSSYGLHRGFERWDDRPAAYVGKYLALPQLGGADLRFGHLSHRDAARITDIAVDWLDEERRGEPFFLFLNYLDAHAPYHPPAPHDRAFDAELAPTDPMTPETELIPLLYDRELQFLDAQVTRFLEALASRGLFDETAIVITSDHGEGLGDHGIAEHCWHLYDALVRVPLYVKPAAGRTAEEDGRPISGAQTFELALELAGVESEPREPPLPGFVGEWYPWEPIHEAYLRIGERVGRDYEVDRVAWLEGTRKVIVSSKDRVEAYDLAADPGEREPLELGADEIEAARRRARAWWEEHPVGADEIELDDDMLERMRALGYGR